jgi:hypothetical protein
MLHSRIGSRPYSQTLEKAGKASQGLALKLITILRKKKVITLALTSKTKKKIVLFEGDHGRDFSSISTDIFNE